MKIHTHQIPNDEEEVRFPISEKITKKKEKEIKVKKYDTKKRRGRDRPSSKDNYYE